MEARLSMKEWRNLISNTPDNPRMIAVAWFHLNMSHDPLGKYLNSIGKTSTLNWVFCDEGENSSPTLPRLS